MFPYIDNSIENFNTDPSDNHFFIIKLEYI